MDLTLEQEAILAALIRRVRDRTQVSILGGLAGTGKTTLISKLINGVPQPAVCAFTGKAANVLRRRDVPATTIHSLIYEPIDEGGYVNFKLRTRLDNCRTIIVDEASMVSRSIYEDLLTFKIPILFIGDHGQLEPISDGFDIMKDPDYRLEQIHRNAGEIARFANWLREGHPARTFDMGHEQVFIKEKKEIRESILLTSVDQIICGTNRTRVGANKRIRQLMGLDPDRPVPGDRVMCLRNDRRKGLFNGMQGRLKSVTSNGEYYHVTFNSDDKNYRVLVDPGQFHSTGRLSRELKDRDMSIPFDYAYCVTAHKMQGDEADSVMVLEQRANWDQARWNYTAASRAREKLYWVVGY